MTIVRLQLALGRRRRRAATRTRRSPAATVRARRRRPVPGAASSTSTTVGPGEAGASPRRPRPAPARRASRPARTPPARRRGARRRRRRRRSRGRRPRAAPMATGWQQIAAVRPVSIVPVGAAGRLRRLGEECAALEKAGVDRIQWDVMDGVFVPNLTFGPDVVAACRPHCAVPFEAHLMVVDPDPMLPRWVEAGCELLIIHAESVRHLHRTLGAVRDAGRSRRRRPQPGDARRRRRARPRPRRHGAGDDRQPRLRRPGLHRHHGAEGAPRCAGCSTSAASTSTSRSTAASAPTPSPAPPPPAPTSSSPGRPSTATPRASATPSPTSGRAAEAAALVVSCVGAAVTSSTASARSVDGALDRPAHRRPGRTRSGPRPPPARSPSAMASA